MRYVIDVERKNRRELVNTLMTFQAPNAEVIPIFWCGPNGRHMTQLEASLTQEEATFLKLKMAHDIELEVK